MPKSQIPVVSIGIWLFYLLMKLVLNSNVKPLGVSKETFFLDKISFIFSMNIC
ncbi:hypothetical protein FEM08_32690 [Flavobacterium gilvum]|nr:hypothetical protein FEM08_32690 [Flavobacterium gilvum]